MNALEKNDLTFGDIVAAIGPWRWKILAIIIVAVMLGMFYVLITPKVYRADALVQLDRTDPGRTPRREGDLKSLSSEFQKVTNAPAEIAVIRSRTLLSGVVIELNLDLLVRPRRFPSASQLRQTTPAEMIPLLFSGLFRENRSLSPGAPVTTLLVPDELLDKPLTLTIGNGKSITLVDERNRLIARGFAGIPVEAQLPSGKLHLEVDAATAVPGARYSVTRKSLVAAINDLQTDLKVGEEGENSGMIRVTLEGENRTQAREIVRAIVRFYESIHTDWRSRDVTDALTYLEEQLPIIDEQAKKAEAALSQFHQTNGTLTMGMDSTRFQERIAALEAEIGNRTRELDNFTPSHPTAIRLQGEIDRLNEEIAEIRSRISRLPRLQERAVELSRNVNVTSEMYAQVMKNVQELRLIKAAISSEIRIIDPGDVLPRPVKPNPPLVLALTLLIGLFVGIAWALLHFRRRGLSDDPDSIEKLLGMPVYATLPFAPRQRRMQRDKRQLAPNVPVVLALQAPGEMVVEGLRGLRTWLNTADFKRAQKGLLITGPTPGIGKTFVSTNLAAVLAAAGRRVLLIEADMRNGNVARQLRIESSPGLSELLSGEVTNVNSIIHSVGGFHCITRGSTNPLSSELLLNGRFAHLLTVAFDSFDDVIIDSPPILAVSDAIIIGQLVGSALLVARANVNTAAELLESKKRLAQAAIPLKGVVYNGVNEGQFARYGYQYTYREEAS